MHKLRNGLTYGEDTFIYFLSNNNLPDQITSMEFHAMKSHIFILVNLININLKQMNAKCEGQYIM